MADLQAGELTVPDAGGAGLTAVQTAAGALHLRLPGKRDQLDPARLAVLQYLAPASPGVKTMFNIELVLEETLMNIVWHAFDNEATHWVDLHVTVDSDTVVMRFEDSGKPFDPTQAADAVPATALADATPGGLGLKLVRRFAQAIVYERHGGRNHLTITMPLH